MIDKGLIPQIQEYLDKHPQEIYWDYRDELTNDQVDSILGGDIDEVRDEIWEYNIDGVSELETAALRDAIEHFNLVPDDPCDYCEDEDGCCEGCKNYLAYDWDELVDELINELLEQVSVTVDTNVEYLVHNTRGKYLALRLPVEHDAYWRDYADVKDELAYFGINPADLRQHYPDVRWYNCPTRTAPKMGVRDLVEAWVNCNYSGHWYAMLDCREALELAMEDKLTGKMVLRKGARIVIHDYWNGTSAIDAHTIADMKVEITDENRPFNDGHYRHGIQSCCDYIGDAWESVLEPA